MNDENDDYLTVTVIVQTIIAIFIGVAMLMTVGMGYALYYMLTHP